MLFRIRWGGIRRPILSPRVQVALMSLSMVVVTVAGSASKRWS